MTLQQSIFAQRTGEPDDVYANRRQKLERVFRNALSGQAGHELIQLLVTHRNPVHPRFAPGRSTEEAAYIDGQCDVIATMMLHGTNMGISKPVEVETE